MPSRFSLFRSGALPVLFGCAVLFTACGSKFQRYEENLVRNQMHGAEDAPEWVRGSIPSTDGELAFVGRGNAFNVLDERKAFDEAFMHARQQLAEYVSTRVTSEACDKDWAKGARFLPLSDAGPGDGEHVGQQIQSRVHQLSDAIVGELLPKSQYWEQWDVDELPPRHWDGWGPTNSFRFEMRRYKCWVLATIRRDRVEKFVDATLGMLKNEAEQQRLAGELKQAQAVGAALVDANGQMEKTMQAQQQEIMKLRERIHYGRVFRLTSRDNCPIDDNCMPPERPVWRNTALRVDLKMPEQKPAAGNSACDTLPLGGN